MKSIPKIALALAACLCIMIIFSACDDSAKPIVLYPYDAGEYLTNVKDSKKILKCQIVFQLTDKNAATAYAEQDFIIRDAVNKELMTLNEDDVKNISLDDLGIRLTEAVNLAMDTTCFHSAYFNMFTAN